MRFKWLDYTKKQAPLVESWLDSDARAFTGCDSGWDDFVDYWIGEGGLTPGADFWCKLISEGDMPVAALALAYDNGILTVSEFVVAPELRGKGYGSAILRELLDNGEAIVGFDIKRARAVIFPANEASKRAFASAGFFLTGAHPDGDALYYDYIKPMPCCCGNDCSRCYVYLATVFDSDELRERSRKFYRDLFGFDIPAEKLRCLGARSGTVFCLCGDCPWVKCCRDRGIGRCADCREYPCPPLAEYAEKYVDKYNRRSDGEPLIR